MAQVEKEEEENFREHLKGRKKKSIWPILYYGKVAGRYKLHHLSQSLLFLFLNPWEINICVAL